MKLKNRLASTLLLAAATITVAAASTAPAGAPIGPDGARHLLGRAAFAASEADIKTFASLSRTEAADRLLNNSGVALTAPPAWVNEAPPAPDRLRKMSQSERMALQRINAEHALELREWWFREMLTTPSPLEEKMTLFWHNHFATSQQKVRFTPLMYEQNVLLRKNALGNFRTLLHQIARDPAMLIYLDGANSRKEQPNENFAREVMELFTLGEGNYTEQDIKEAARAFTGWSIDRETGKFMFRRGIHDYGRKTVLGKTGAFEGDQVLDVLLAQPAAARFITAKLWKEFVSLTPNDKEIDRLSGVFRDSGYDTGKLMRAMLTSDAFYAPENRAALIKSPVELVVGTLKTFDIDTGNLRPFVLASAFLGQNLFAPPNVKGWPGGETWINSASLLGRKQLIDRLFHNEDRSDARADKSVEMTAMRSNDSGGETVTKDASNEPATGAAGRLARQQRNMERQMGNLRWNIDKWAEANAGKMDQPVPVAQFAGMTRTVLAMPPQIAQAETAMPADWLRQLVADPAYQLK